MVRKSNNNGKLNLKEAHQTQDTKGKKRVYRQGKSVDDCDLSADNELIEELEALLFIYGKPITIKQISKLISKRDEEIERGLEQLRQIYQNRKGAIIILRDGEEWHMTVREKFSYLSTKLVHEINLPKSVLETLAVVAWKAPVLQSEVIELRNNKAYDHLDLLEQKGFITRKAHGKTYMIHLTKKFYDYFELSSRTALKKLMNNVFQDKHDEHGDKLHKI